MRTLLFTLLLLFPVNAAAQLPEQALDSLDYTLDDGIQSPEEMVEEANYLYQYCRNNPFQNLYFNCECLAGAFLQEREKLGPIVPQQDIMYDLTKSSRAVCANTERIAGSVYQSCLNYSYTRREERTDHEEYCTCAANRMAREFTRAPRLNERYIERMRTRTMLSCNDPSKR